MSNHVSINWASIIDEVSTNPQEPVRITDEQGNTIQLILSSMHLSWPSDEEGEDDTCLSSADFDRATVVESITPDTHDMCPVCHCKLSEAPPCNGENDKRCVRPFACTHVFHRGCLLRWCLEFHSHCPICRIIIG